ncbi:MAG: hypothetical protein C0621_04775 [Desulfuromonas sp.]|nr:MAG: hypothetical protein C0621_04775 [Desulfuromonas sp.]
MLLESYCHGGTLAPLCRRRTFLSFFKMEPPDDLAPNGYLVESHRKIRMENCREHTRHKVTDCICLLQVVDTAKTFDAWMVDISEGGVQLALNTHPEVLKIGAENDQIKILGYSAESLPIPLDREILRVAWQNEQTLGCAFMAPQAL